MTQTCSENDLTAAVSEVLESMCFLEPETIVTPSEDGEVRWVSRRLEFHGVYEGSFGLRATVPAATIIACNLLGEDPDELTDRQIGESMGEIANMVCGAILGRVEVKQAFDLTSPYDDRETSANPEVEGEISSSFALEDGVLTTWLQIRPKA